VEELMNSGRGDCPYRVDNKCDDTARYVQFQLKWKETTARGQFIPEVATWDSAHEKCLLIIWLKVK
jgi:hypothetical protein